MRLTQAVRRSAHDLVAFGIDTPSRDTPDTRGAMALRTTSPGKSGIMCLSFNQDNTCVVLGTTSGIEIFNLGTHRQCYVSRIGAIGVAEMLFCTSLLAYAGAGEQPTLTPRRVTVLNTSTGRPIQDMAFETSVLAVRMNRKRLVVVVEARTHVYDLQSLQLLRTLEHGGGGGGGAAGGDAGGGGGGGGGAGRNPRGVCALSACSEPNLLALPASEHCGTLRVYDLLVDGGEVLCELRAHDGPLQAAVWNHDCCLLATASTKGTIIRVHRMPHASKRWAFRRGLQPAAVHSLAFSPPSVHPPLLAATSSHGTLHVFRLDPPAERGPVAVATAAAVGFLSSIIAKKQAQAGGAASGGVGSGGGASGGGGGIADDAEPARHIAVIKLPGTPGSATCSLHCTSPGGGAAAAALSSSSGADGAAAGSLPHDDDLGDAALGGGGGGAQSAQPADSIVVAVATLDGYMYEYLLEGLNGSDTAVAAAGGSTSSAAGRGPAVTLEGEWPLLRSTNS